MLQYSDVQMPFVSVVQIPEILNVESELSQSNNNSINSTIVSSNESPLNSVFHRQYTIKKDIYVCTFCQVFSPNFATVSNHISIVHSESLLPETKPENYVSKLQQLEETYQRKKGKPGRPRKENKLMSEKKQLESVASQKSKSKITDPVPDAAGLFWCKTCLRHFRKSRQLMQHICLESEGEISSDESSAEIDNDVEFKTYMNIDNSPWSRRKKIRKYKENTSNVKNLTIETMEGQTTEGNRATENKGSHNWRNDPTYIPLFDDEHEKAAFEEHLKSIDYSYVDSLYSITEKHSKNKNKKNCTDAQNVIFSCNFCKKNCKSLSLIRTHCLIHTDVKPFTCPKCSYRTNSTGSLYMHMRIHTGNVFRCSFCDFKSIKRSHLLDHEATHSTVYQICKLCKNPYKTLKSLIGHVRNYHKYSGGKKYLKSLTCKQRKFKCNVCNKKFKSLDILNNHNHACHEITSTPNIILTEENSSEQNSEAIDQDIRNIQMQINSVNDMQLPTTNLQCSDIRTKDPLADIVLNDFLHQQQSQDILYQNVFNQSGENVISPSNNNLLENFQTKVITKSLAAESSILEECQKTLDLGILKECLQNGRFSENCQDFNLIPNVSGKHSLQNNSKNNTNVTNHLSEISADKLEEPKSVEIKLFEKCQRAPAYVCCVCSSIYICPATLKAHLREHVNNTISSLIDQPEEQFEPTKITEANNELDVCDILQDSSESFSFNKELEKLYTSSLDLMYYLPEVSVVLENDAALFDSMLDDISNFPISDNPAQDLNDKVEEENVLKMFKV